jgi:hypothetical protein
MTTFSLRRVAQYTAKHYAEYGRKYALMFGVIIVALAAMALLIWAKFKFFLEIEGIFQTMLVCLCAVVLGVANMSFCSLDRTTNRASLEMTLPLTSAERYAFVFLNTLIMGVLVPFAISCAFDFWDCFKAPMMLGLYLLVHPYVMVAYCWARRLKYAVVGLVLLWALTMFSLASVSSTIGMPAFGDYLHFSLPESYEFFKAGPMMYGSGIEFDYPMWIEWLFTVVMWALAYVIAYFKLRERRLA